MNWQLSYRSELVPDFATLEECGFSEKHPEFQFVEKTEDQISVCVTMTNQEKSITTLETENASVDEFKQTIRKLFDIPDSSEFRVHYNDSLLEEGTLKSNSISAETCPSTIRVRIVQPPPSKSATNTLDPQT